MCEKSAPMQAFRRLKSNLNHTRRYRHQCDEETRKRGDAGPRYHRAFRGALTVQPPQPAHDDRRGRGRAGRRSAAQGQATARRRHIVIIGIIIIIIINTNTVVGGRNDDGIAFAAAICSVQGSRHVVATAARA